MAGMGPAIFSGLLSGLSGLPQGMQQGEELNLQKQRLAEQQRQFDESRLTDPSTLTPALQAAGINLNLPPGKIQTSLLPTILQASITKAEQARKQALTGELSKALEPGMATPTPGTTFETAPSPLAPRTVAPMSSVATPEDPMAKLRRVLPILTQFDPASATKAVMDLAMPQKPMLVPETTVGTLSPTTGEYRPLPGAQPQPFTPPANYQATYTQGPHGRVSTQFKPIEARDDFDRAAYQVTQGQVSRYEDLNPAQRTQADNYVKQFRGDISARVGEAGALGRQAAERTATLPPGQAAELGVPYGTTQEGAYGRKPLTPTQQTKVDAQSSVLAIINNVEQDLKKIQTPSGPLGRIYQAPQNMWGVYAQADPELAALNGRIGGTLSLIIRSLGEVGTLTDRDIARAQALMPKFVPIPDSQETIAAKMNGLRQLVQDVAGRAGTRPESAPTPKATPQAAPAPTGPRRRRYNPATGLLE